MMLSFNTNSDKTKENLIFFPFAGAAGEIYLPWFKYFDETIACRYALLKGRGKYFHLPAHDNLQDLIESLIPEIVKMSYSPFSFFGHSMGALIAFELSRQLFIQHGLFPSHLFVSGFRAPSLPYRRQFLHQMNKQELFSHLQSMQEKDVLQDISLEMLEPFLPTLYNDFKLCELYTYQPAAPLPCEIFVLYAHDDQTIEQDKIALWKQESTKPVRFHSFPGGHFYLNKQVKNIIKIIMEALKK